MDRDWARLPAHILDSVVDRLELVSHYLRFSVVCKPWYCVAMENKTQQAKLVLCAGRPMLLISADVENTWNVYNVMDNKVLNLQLNLPNKRFCGGSKGWLITVEENFAVTLVNPFMRIKGERNKENSIIRLPQLTQSGRSTTFWSERCSRYVIKAAISADPIVEADKCIVMVIEAEMSSMAFFRLGKDTTWTYIADTIGMCDVIFDDHKNLGPNFFFVDYLGFLYSSGAASSTDLECSLSEVDDDTVLPLTLPRYLVDTNGGDPLLIERMVKYDQEEVLVRTTVEFKVFEVNHREGRWNERDTLGDDIAIFLGNNTAISVTASKFSGCEPNSIYFVRDLDARPVDKFELRPGPGDNGVYNLETKSFSQGPFSTVVQTLLTNTKLCPFWVEGLTPLQFKLI